MERAGVLWIAIPWDHCTKGWKASFCSSNFTLILLCSFVRSFLYLLLNWIVNADFPMNERRRSKCHKLSKVFFFTDLIHDNSFRRKQNIFLVKVLLKTKVRSNSCCSTFQICFFNNFNPMFLNWKLKKLIESIPIFSNCDNWILKTVKF